MALLSRLVSLLALGCLPFLPLHAAPVMPAINEQATGLQLPGKFVWHELISSDLTASQAFYSKVFGWTFEKQGTEANAYTLIRRSGRPLGGMVYMKKPEGAVLGARWLPLLSVKDPAEAARFVTSHGGHIQVAVTERKPRGTDAFFVDPEGVLFGVLRSDSGDPADTEPEAGAFVWGDLLVRNTQLEAAFYQGLFGYQLSDKVFGKGAERLVLTSAGKIRAGISVLPERAKRPAWLLYVGTESISDTLKLVTEAGGTVLLAPSPELLDGRLAVFSDSLGGVIGLLERKKN